jgi:prepilin-type N-terminal cleavage/methylation domain-containing protein
MGPVREPIEGRKQQGGFTIIEIAIVVSILGVLAAIVIPNWADSARNRKYDPEISAMFTEISTREEQYKSEQGNGAYLMAAQCPASPSPNGIDFNASCVTGATAWVTMRVVATDPTIRCTYQVTTGLPASVPAPPAPCPGPGVNPIAGSWYYDIATCDMDGNGGTNATFCMTSWNTATQKLNYGQ